MAIIYLTKQSDASICQLGYELDAVPGMVEAGAHALARYLPDVTDTTAPERLEDALSAIFVAMALAGKRDA